MFLGTELSTSYLISPSLASAKSFCIVFHDQRKKCPNSLSQSLPGAHPLTKKSELSGCEIDATQSGIRVHIASHHCDMLSFIMSTWSCFEISLSLVVYESINPAGVLPFHFNRRQHIIFYINHSVRINCSSETLNGFLKRDSELSSNEVGVPDRSTASSEGGDFMFDKFPDDVLDRRKLGIKF